MDLWIFYRENKDFHDYVDRYCVKHKISPDEAIRHVIVKAYAEQLSKRIAEVVKVETKYDVEDIKACGGC